MHGPVRAPDTIAAGTADVTISLDGWKEAHVAPSRHQIEVLPAIIGPKLEPVSPRLTATLVHADRNSELYGVRYSPDGSRIIAGGYPGGIVQVWDAETGRQLARFEAGHGFRASAEYFCISPDWKALFAPTKGERKHTPFERDGKRLLRWEFDGEVRAWDMESGDLLDVYRHEPRRNIRLLSLSPDGSTLLTGDELPGESEGAPGRAVSLWDVRSQQHRPLPGGLGILGVFSPDGGTVAVVARGDVYVTALKLFDVDSLAEKLSIPVPHEFAVAGVHDFTPNGAMLLGYVQVFPADREWQSSQTFLKLWDTATGEELASFTTGEKNSAFGTPVFSPDGGLFAAVGWQTEQGKLYLIDSVDRKRVGTIVLTRKRNEGENLFLSEPAFSSDRRWLAVATQFLPEGLGSRTPRYEELLQPRIHLVDVARCAVAETLVAPQGSVASVCFSPDGKTLAAGGHGKILLWNLEVPPGTLRER